MPRPRDPDLEPKKEIIVRIEEKLLSDVNLRLLDPLTGKAKYGERSILICKLLREWLACPK